MATTDQFVRAETPSCDRGRKLRVALFTETFLPRIDGTVTRFCQTVKHLKRAGHEVLVIAPEGGLQEYEGARVLGLSGFPFPLYPELKLSLPRASVLEELDKFQPDLVHAFNPVLLGINAFQHSRKRRVPMVVSYHCHLPKWLPYYKLAWLEPLTWWSLRTAYNKADLLLATSDPVKNILSEKGMRRLELWPRGVDTEQFAPHKRSQAMRQRLTQGHPEDVLVLYVGRLSPEKSLESFRPVLDAFPQVRVALVGDGPHRAKLEQLLGGPRVHFTGYMCGEELSAAYASSDVFLLPSRTETLGLVLMEAMAAGRAVVGAAGGGVVDIVQDRITGHLFEPENADSLVNAMRRLVEDREYREETGRVARLDMEKWSWEASTRKLEQYYESVLKREQELPRKIGECQLFGHTDDRICEILEISRATLRRHNGQGAGAASA